MKPKILVPRTTRPLNPKWASIDPLGSIRLVRLGSLDQCGFQKYKFYKYRFYFLQCFFFVESLDKKLLRSKNDDSEGGPKE